MLSEGIQTILQTVANVSMADGPPYAVPASDELMAASIPHDLMSIIKFLLSFGALRDYVKILVLGSLLETARRLATSAYDSILGSFVYTFHFEGHEIPYGWLMVWLSNHPSWSNTRNLQVSSRAWFPFKGPAFALGSRCLLGKGGKGLAFLPSYGTTHSLFYKRRYMRMTRSKRFIGEGQVQEGLVVTVFTRSPKIINELLLEAKIQFETEEEVRVPIYIADMHNNWVCVGSRPKRSMESIILDPAIKNRIVEDARDFMDNEAWYGQRGIPFRRGYLLHGVPGSGKTSIIHAIAGELNLSIYILTLSKKGLDDSNLNELICDMPTRSIVLMEDIDAAFTHSLTRETTDSDSPYPGGGNNGATQGITLGGLLSAIDGIAAQEGRLLFATTNKYHALDPALSRPGRMDLHIEFGLATKWQAAQLFKHFYPISPAGSPEYSSLPIIMSDEIEPSPTSSSPGAAFQQSKVPILSQAELAELADEFADAVPEEELSVASLQGHLMMYKTRPRDAARLAKEFVEGERERSKVRSNQREGEGEKEGEKSIMMNGEEEEKVLGIHGVNG